MSQNCPYFQFFFDSKTGILEKSKFSSESDSFNHTIDGQKDRRHKK